MEDFDESDDDMESKPPKGKKKSLRSKLAIEYET